MKIQTMLMLFGFCFTLNSFAGEPETCPAKKPDGCGGERNVPSCPWKIENYAKELLRLDGVKDVQECGTFPENCLHPLEFEPSGTNTKYTAVYEYGGAYPSFYVYFLTVDSSCEILNVSHMKN